MATERDREPDQEKKKTLEEWLKEVFEAIVQKIRDLEKRREITTEEKTLLEALQKQKDARRAAYKEEPYGKATNSLIDAVKKNLEQVRKDLEKASAAEAKQKRDIAQQTYEQAWDRAQAHLQQQPADFRDKEPNRLDGIAEHDFNHVLERGRIAINKEIEKKDGEKIRKKAREAEEEKRGEERGRPIQERPEDEEALKARIQWARQRLMENPGDPEARAVLQELVRNQRESFYDLFRPDEVERIKYDLDFREKAFQIIINRFGINPNRHFQEADMMTHMGLTQFSLAVLELPEGRDILQEYNYRLGFEEQIHNLDMFFRGHSKIVEVPQVLSQFESRMFDMALRQKGVVVAFRAYEQAFNRLMMTEGRLPPSKIGMDPDDKKIWINQWVRQQVRSTLQNYCQEQGLDYKKEFEEHIDTITRTGWKIFIFTMRGDEIQASTVEPRKSVEAPWHEDMWRRLDPLSLPTKYWKQRVGPEGFLEINDETTATALWYYATGEDKSFKTPEEYEAALKKAQEEGRVQLNLFDIGGILSVSDWRSTDAMKHIPKALWPFMGIEMERKLLQDKNLMDKKPMDQISARRKAFEHGFVRNPFALFRLADEQDQEAILANCGVSGARKKAFLDSIYDNMAQALQREVFRQQQEMAQILKLPKEQQEAAAAAFAQREKGKGLDFGFVSDARQRADLDRFVGAIQNRFKEGSEAVDNLTRKRYAYSLGTEDVPLEVMRFLEVGDIGLQRRFRDIGEIAGSAEALWKFIKGQGVILQKEESIIEGLAEIHEGLYGAGVPNTDNIMEALVSRTLEMLAEDKWQSILPWPANTIRDKYWFTSKAEKMFGQYHMSLSSNDMRLLLEKIIGAGLFTKAKAQEVRKMLYKKHGLRTIDIIIGRLWEYMPVMIPAGLLISAIMIFYEQFKKDIEETAKET